MTGSEIIKLSLPILLARGWTIFHFGHNHPMPQGAKGFPDIVGFRQDETLTIEVKGDGDNYRPEQRKFAEVMRAFTGPHLRYCLAQSVEDVEEASR